MKPKHQERSSGLSAFQIDMALHPVGNSETEPWSSWTSSSELERAGGWGRTLTTVSNEHPLFCLSCRARAKGGQRSPIPRVV